VPFNEPDWIWYDLKTTDQAQYIANRDRFLADWAAACRTIRSLNPGALIVGPNEAYYDSRFIPDFLSYAKAGDVLPDVISWHELRPSSLRTYRSSYTGFRELEKQLGIPPLPIDINEYGNRRDLSNPWAGTYRVIVSYASNDRAESGNYNANLIDRGFNVTTSAGTQLTTYARNTYSWNQFNTVGLTVQLAAGENTIVLGNPLGHAPDIDKIIVAPAALP
jgi:hypothetical protein